MNKTIDSLPETDKLLYRVEDAARLLDISVPTLYRLMAAGELPYTKLNRRIRRIRYQDLIAFVNRNTYGA
ncbi:MAG: helix-turn-helix domain-containing protein [Chloroflexaceae bacterium]|nr:helix-turn-helix domain-containing protein [Chloroflexaceae bacterium]